MNLDLHRSFTEGRNGLSDWDHWCAGQWKNNSGEIYRSALRHSVCGCRRGQADEQAGVKVDEELPLYERLQVQMEIARHIELITRGMDGFVIDRTPADVVAYTLDLVGQTNEDRCIELAMEIERFCHQAVVSNFNAIVGLRPGVCLTSADRSREQRGSLDRSMSRALMR